MNPLGASYATDEVVRGAFNTRTAAGAPSSLAGTPSLALDRTRDGTTSTITSGITLTVDVGSVTGLHAYVIDLDTIDAEAGDQYVVRIAQGTVDGQSVAGSIVGHFFVAEDGLTDAQAAAVLAQAGAALTAYDPPTAAELDAAVAPLATADALATVDDEVGTILGRVVGTIASGTHQPQSGDAYSRIGANGAGLTALASASALAVVDGIVDAILVDTDTTIPALIGALNDLDAAGIRAALGMAAANMDTQLEGIADGAGLDAAGVRAAVGLASANLDTQLSGLGSAIDEIEADVDVAAIADAVWDEALAGHDTEGSAGHTLGNVATGTPPSAGAIAEAVWSAVSRTLTESTGEAPTPEEVASAVWEATERLLTGADNLGIPSAGDIRSAVGLAQANLDAQLSALDGIVSAISGAVIDHADGEDLAADVATLQAAVDAIRGKTDGLTFAEGGAVQANVARVNDVRVIGAGTEDSPWGAAP